jgi:hypothetical protein
MILLRRKKYEQGVDCWARDKRERSGSTPSICGLMFLNPKEA